MSTGQDGGDGAGVARVGLVVLDPVRGGDRRRAAGDRDRTELTVGLGGLERGHVAGVAGIAVKPRGAHQSASARRRYSTAAATSTSDTSPAAGGAQAGDDTSHTALAEVLSDASPGPPTVTTPPAAQRVEQAATLALFNAGPGDTSSEALERGAA